GARRRQTSSACGSSSCRSCTPQAELVCLRRAPASRARPERGKQLPLDRLAWLEDGEVEVALIGALGDVGLAEPPQARLDGRSHRAVPARVVERVKPLLVQAVADLLARGRQWYAGADQALQLAGDEP